MGYFKREFVVGIDYGLYKNVEDEHLQKCLALPVIEDTHDKPLIEVVN